MAQQFAGYDGQAFSVSAVTGALAAATNGEIVQFRWTDLQSPTRRIRVLGVTASAAVGATGFTAGPVVLDLAIARAWTVAGTGGGTLTVTGNNQKLRTSQNPTLFNTNAGAEIRVASTAALGAGTKTLDANAVGSIVFGAGAAGSVAVPPNSVLWQDSITAYGQPIILNHQEGLVVRAGTLPALGTLQVAVNFFWAEVD